MATVLECVLPKSSVLLCVFMGKRTRCERYSQRYVSCFGWEVFVASALVANVSLIKQRLKRTCRSGLRNSQETSVVPVPKDW
jgi:hypothetical protein